MHTHIYSRISKNYEKIRSIIELLEEERMYEAEEILEVMMTENIPKLMTDTNHKFMKLRKP